MLRLAGSAIERRKMMNNYEKVAYWITEMECDDPREEVVWLLAMLDEGGGKTKPTFKEAYKFLWRRIEDE